MNGEPSDASVSDPHAYKPHTRTKHEILRRYLQAWYPIMAKLNKRLLYIDGFAGPGKFSGGQLGSPLIALEVAAKASLSRDKELDFVFVEKGKTDLERLRKEVTDLDLPPNFQCFCRHGEFDEVVGKSLYELDSRGTSLPPAFAFVDPKGYSGVPISVLHNILQNNRCEVFVTVMVAFMSRFLTVPSTADHCVEFFGTETVKDILNKPGSRIELLRDLYKSQLQVRAKYVCNFEMRNDDNCVLYYLFFGTNDKTGFEKMKDAMWKHSQCGQLKFSDSHIDEQPFLYSVEPAGDLWKQMNHRYSGKSEYTDSIREFVLCDTDFLTKHMNQALREAESEGLIQVANLKKNGERRIKQTFPDGVMVKFLDKTATNQNGT